MISAGAVYAKLAPKLRMMLILVDGSKPVLILREEAGALGIKAFFFTLKMEKCATVDDLRGMVEAYRAAIAKASGEAEADVLVRRLQEILG